MELFYIMLGAFFIIFISMKLSKKDDKKTEDDSNISSEIERKREVDFEKTRPLREARTLLSIKYQEEIDKGWKNLVDRNKPVTTVSVSKIAHEDKYHFYWDIGGVKAGDKAEVASDYQEREDGEAWREAYVVSVEGSEVGELTESSIEKIERFTVWDEAAYVVKEANDDGDRPVLKLDVYESHTEIPGHRSWSMDLMGINYEGRDAIVKENGAGVCKLEPTTYEDEPAVKVLDALDREMGWVPKEYAQEVTNHLIKGKISRVRIDNIKHKDDNIYAKLFLLIKNYL